MSILDINEAELTYRPNISDNPINNSNQEVLLQQYFQYQMEVDGSLKFHEKTELDPRFFQCLQLPTLYPATLLLKH